MRMSWNDIKWPRAEDAEWLDVFHLRVLSRGDDRLELASDKVRLSFGFDQGQVNLRIGPIDLSKLPEITTVMRALHPKAKFEYMTPRPLTAQIITNEVVRIMDVVRTECSGLLAGDFSQFDVVEKQRSRDTGDFIGKIRSWEEAYKAKREEQS